MSNDRLVRESLRLRRRIRELKKQIKSASEGLQTYTLSFDSTLRQEILKEVKRLEKPNRKKVREIKRVSRLTDK